MIGCVTIVDLFDAKIVKYVADDKLPLKNTLQREARQAHQLILWLDCDREGENIAYEVVQVCREVNPRLHIRRAHFSALIPR